MRDTESIFRKSMSVCLFGLSDQTNDGLLFRSEVDALVAPRSETVKTVEKWLDSHGVKVTGRSVSGDWVHVTVPVSRAEKMLNTRVRNSIILPRLILSISFSNLVQRLSSHLR